MKVPNLLDDVLEQKNYEQARVYCYEQVYLHPTEVKALKLLFDFSIRYGETGPSKDLIGKLKLLAVDTGNSPHAIQEYENACAEITKLLEKPQNHEILEECLNLARAAMKYSKKSLFLRVTIVKCLIKLERLPEAEKTCDELLEDAPSYVPVLHQKAAIKFAQGLHEKSLSFLKRALQIDPDYRECKVLQVKVELFMQLMQKADYQVEEKQNDEAIITYSKLVISCLNENANHRENLVTLYNSRAKCFLVTHQIEKLFEDCINSLSIRRTTEAEALLEKYFIKKSDRKLELKNSQKGEKSKNEYLTDRTNNADDEDREAAESNNNDQDGKRGQAGTARIKPNRKKSVDSWDATLNFYKKLQSHRKSL